MPAAPSSQPIREGQREPGARLSLFLVVTAVKVATGCLSVKA